jgi:signal peptidase II
VGALGLILAAAEIALAADAVTKAATSALPAGGIGSPSFGLRRVVNRRGSLLGAPIHVAVALLAAFTVVAVAAAALSWIDPLAAAGFGLVIGGSLGNLVDRVRGDGVVDFVFVGRWPAFNVADVALVCGTVICAVAAIR